MTGPGWLAASLAVIMAVTAGYRAVRVVLASGGRRSSERDIDLAHVLMGIAMAGMLVPAASLRQNAAWIAVFAAAAGWFGWQAARELAARDRQRAAHHLPHLLAAGTMVYMLNAAGHASLVRPFSAASAMTAAGPRPLAFLLAVALVGTVALTADRLALLAPVRAGYTARQAGVTAGRTGVTAGRAVALAGQPSRLPLSPRLSALCDIVMGLTMCYMLIAM